MFCIVSSVLCNGVFLLTMIIGVPLSLEQTLITFLVFDFACMMHSFWMNGMYNELLLQTSISIYSNLKWKIGNFLFSTWKSKIIMTKEKKLQFLWVRIPIVYQQAYQTEKKRKNIGMDEYPCFTGFKCMCYCSFLDPLLSGHAYCLPL